jgi:hypothetical protein
MKVRDLERVSLSAVERDRWLGRTQHEPEPPAWQRDEPTDREEREAETA